MKGTLTLAAGMLISTMMLGAVQDPVVQARKSGKPVVVFFTKNRCRFCVQLRPDFSRLQSKTQGVIFLVVDVGANAEHFKETYDFSTVPTVIYYTSKGKEVVRHGSNNGRMTLGQMQVNLNRART